MELRRGFNLVRSPEEWEEYKQLFAKNLGVAAAANLLWGPGPEWYPAMVATCRSWAGRSVTAIVYPAQARELLDAVAEMPPSSERVEQLNRAIKRVYDAMLKTWTSSGGFQTSTLARVAEISHAETQAALEQLHRWKKVDLRDVGCGNEWALVQPVSETPWPTQSSLMPPAELKQARTVKDYSLRVNANIMTIVQVLERNGNLQPGDYEKRLAANLGIIDRWHEEDKRALLAGTPAAAAADMLTDRSGGEPA